MLCGIAFSVISGRSRGKSNPATGVASVLCSHEGGGFVGRIVDRNRLLPVGRNAVCLRSRSPYCVPERPPVTTVRTNVGSEHREVRQRPVALDNALACLRDS